MKHWILGMSALALVSIGCAHGEASQTAAAPAVQPMAHPHTGMRAGMTGDKMAAMCPMAVPGTQVSSLDTATGEMITFSTTSPDQVAELRTRVRAMADMHNQHHGAGGMQGMHEHEGMMSGSGGDSAMASMPMPPPSTATVEDIDGGARLVLAPTDPAQLAQLQSAVRSHAQMMQQQGACGMMKQGETPTGH
ncbi:MAG: hypothetical protein ACXWLM_07230 [Myxococcales bacterium]